MSNLKQKRFVDTDYLQESVIERLEILENVTEGQNMEYSTDQGFIHCNNTKKGRVNDLTIEGNTMVNYCTDGSKTLTLNGDINEVGTHITTTNAVNNGLVDVMCEGETLVNVCNQKDPVAITKSYTVENTNHVPLQGEYDGKARPVVEGNTLVNLTSSSDYLAGDAIKIDDNYFRLTASGTFRNLFYNKDKYKPNTKYTVIVDIRKNTLNGYFRVADATTSSVFIVDPSITIEQGKTGRFIYTLTTLSDLSECTVGLRTWVSSLCTEGVLEVRIMTLEGDLTANPPSGYIEGLKSSFEDNKVPQNINNSDLWIYSNGNPNRWQLNAEVLPSKPITIINNSDKFIYFEMNSDTQGTGGTWLSSTPIPPRSSKLLNTVMLRTIQLRVADGWSSSSVDLSNVYLVEGDYTNYDLLDYDPTKAGKYRVDYKVTGKNKIDLTKVTRGAFTSTIPYEETTWQSYVKSDFIKVKPNTTYTACIPKYEDTNISYSDFRVGYYNENKVLITNKRSTDKTFTVPEGVYYIKVAHKVIDDNQGQVDPTKISDWQLEEGTTATTYEEYKEYTKTFYLNSPLLEGDTIEDVNGKATHIKRSKQVVINGSDVYKSATYQSGVFRWQIYHNLNVANMDSTIRWTKNNRFPDITANDTWGNNGIYKEGIAQNNSSNHIFLYLDRYSDGSDESLNALKNELKTNPVTVVYQLSSPIYETISEESILTDSYVNGHLDLDTNVTVNKVKFIGWGTSLKYIQASTNYTIQFTSDNNGKLNYIGLNWKASPSYDVVKGINRFNVVVGDTINSTFFELNGIGFNASNISVVATEREFNYFEGLSSVGQDDENGHNIEILSSKGKPNLIRNSGFLNDTVDYSFHNGAIGEVIDDVSSQSGKILKITTSSNNDLSGPFQPNIVSHIENKTYTLSGWCKGEPGTSIEIFIERHTSKIITFTNDDWVRFVVTTDQNPTNWNRTITFYSSNLNKVFYLKDIKMEESENDTPYVPHIEEKNYATFKGINKKSIPLNEPLRSLPNGVKDKFVKMNNKWYIERRCGEVVLDGSEDITIHNSDSQTYIRFRVSLPSNALSSLASGTILTTYYRCYGVPHLNMECHAGANPSNEEGLYNGSAYINNKPVCYISIQKSKLTTQNEYGFSQWLNSNNITVVYELSTPVYEELTVDPTLTTYVDCTHISTNSVIPCDMKVKNSGYNVLLKPSTLYTVALDTSNREGTNVISDIKVNLGGAEKTATNNIVTLTTPSTLVDDSLRISGKGLTSKNVRLLEGDNTNFIPSYFEGLKSSFEEKQGDNHIVEVISNNKNLLDLNNTKIYNANFSYDRLICREDNNGLIVDKKIENNKLSFTVKRHCTYGVAFLIKTIPNKKYTLKAKGKCVGGTMQSQVDYFTLAYRTSINNESDWTRETLPTDFLREYDNIKNVPIETEGEVTFTAKHNYAVVGICSTYMDWVNTDTPDNDMAMYEFEDICVTQSDIGSDYIPHETNKIQFSTLEPLRSVGDISDKLVYKDNKWMIERNCGEVVLDGSTQATINSRDNFTKTIGFYMAMNEALKQTTNVLSNKFNFKLLDVSNDVYEFTRIITPNGVPSLYFKIFKIKLPTQDVNGFKQWLSNNPTTVVYELAEPYYEEIGEHRNLDSYDEGTTIYANTLIAPKPLSFNLATHMSNIVKDVQDDVSDLKTWRSEVFDSITHKKTFDSGFTIVEDTKEGVIDEIKLEGKTLVNKLSNAVKGYQLNATIEGKNKKITMSVDSDRGHSWFKYKVEDGDHLVFDITKNTLNNDMSVLYNDSSGIEWITQGKVGRFCVKLDSSKEDIRFALHSLSTGEIVFDNIMIINKHNLNEDVSYFEGLKSVGDGVDEIVVSSVNNGNLFEFNSEFIKVDKWFDTNGAIIDNFGNGLCVYDKFIAIPRNVDCIIGDKLGTKVRVCFYDENKIFIKRSDLFDNTLVFNENASYIKIGYRSLDGDISSTRINVGSSLKLNQSIKQDKKSLLYYNEETQTWEKPVLREWDSIEKHSDGKYYYHKRCEQVVLDGSESWVLAGSPNQIDTKVFAIKINGLSVDGLDIANCISSNFKTVNTYSEYNADGHSYICTSASTIYIRIENSKLSTQDAQGFKQWLQDNNVTVVYQLAQEKVYEVFNIELNSYDGETNIIVNSGAISPITTVSLTSNLPQVAENLKNRVRHLEDEVYNYRVSQNLRQLRTFYRSDYANFGVSIVNDFALNPTEVTITPYALDLFEIFKEVIAQGKDKYDRIELEEYIDFYLMTFVFDFDMVFELFDLLDANEDIIEDEPVEEEPPMEEEEEIVEDTPTILPLLPEDEEVVEDTPTILPILPEDEATIIPLI